MDDLAKGIQDNMSRLKGAIRSRYQVAVKRANAEYQYRTTLGREMASAKLEGMAATALYDYCRGLEHVAGLRTQRDILQAQEEYLTDMIFYYRAEIRIAENQINAERKGL